MINIDDVGTGVVPIGLLLWDSATLQLIVALILVSFQTKLTLESLNFILATNAFRLTLSVTKVYAAFAEVKLERRGNATIVTVLSVHEFNTR